MSRPPGWVCVFAFLPLECLSAPAPLQVFGQIDRQLCHLVPLLTTRLNTSVLISHTPACGFFFFLSHFLANSCS